MFRETAVQNHVRRILGTLFSGAFLLATATGCSDLGSPITQSDPLGPDAPISIFSSVETGRLSLQSSSRDRAIPGRLLVTVSASHPGSVRELAEELSRTVGGEVERVYNHALKGFAMRIPEAASTAVQAALLRSPFVVRVEVDQEVFLGESGSRFETLVRNLALPENSISPSGSLQVQTSPPWGLDRIDQRTRPLDELYTWSHDGSGVRAYIVDSGIRFDHVDFQGRAVFGIDLIGDGLNGGDCSGHGTHVAGTLGGARFGVAKGATLVSVRAFGCGTGTNYGTLIAAVDWVAGQSPRALPAVVNLSFDGPLSATFNEAADALIDRGFVVTGAAGNWGIDACTRSPASIGRALTIAATNQNDDRSPFSNHGACVDLFAPGSSILSADIQSTVAESLRSGTSMAAPHVAGVAAILLSQRPGSTPAEVAAQIRLGATEGIVTNAFSSNNHLVHSLSGFPDLGPPPTPTVVQFDIVNRTSGPWARADVTWTVAHSIGLSWVQLELLNGASVVAIQTNPLTGTSASGFNDLRFRGSANAVRLTVMGVTGTATSATRMFGSGDDGGDGGFTLSATPNKVRGLWEVTLNWLGTDATSIDLFRNGVRIGTVGNTGTFLDATGLRNGGLLTYLVCEGSGGAFGSGAEAGSESGTQMGPEANPAVCSNEVTVRF